jgi:hypothetical protein
MNALMARAVSFGVVVAVWTVISHYGRLPLQLWPVLIGVACFAGSGGGVPGAQKSAAGVVTGVAWGLVGTAVSGALGRSLILDALITGVVVFGIVFQGQVAMLSYTAGALAGAAPAVGARAVNMEGGLRTAIALLIGVGLGFAAEFGAAKIKPRR